jgi:hypothetical protein
MILNNYSVPTLYFLRIMCICARRSLYINLHFNPIYRINLLETLREKWDNCSKVRLEM